MTCVWIPMHEVTLGFQGTHLLASTCLAQYRRQIVVKGVVGTARALVTFALTANIAGIWLDRLLLIPFQMFIITVLFSIRLSFTQSPALFCITSSKCSQSSTSSASAWKTDVSRSFPSSSGCTLRDINKGFSSTIVRTLLNHWRI